MKPSPRLRIGFTGYYGMSNFGDDLFGMICAEGARRMLGGEPRLAGPLVAGVDASYTMPRWFPRSLYGSGGWFGKASRFYSFALATATSDVLMLGGGSIVNSRESFRRPMMVSAQQRGKLQLAAVGVSIGPFDGKPSRDAAAEFLGRFAYIAVRDRRSHELAVEMGLGGQTHHGRDLAGLLPLLLPAAPQIRPDPDGRPARIGVALCNYGDGGSYPVPAKDGVVAELALALAHLAGQRPVEVDLFILNDHARHGDRELSRGMLQWLEGRGIPAKLVAYGGQNPLEIARRIGQCDAMISARLHGAIVAYMQRVPFTIIDYHPKCRDFADDVGLPGELRITSTNQDAAAFGTALEAMLEHVSPPALPHERYAEQALDIFKCSPWWSAR